MALGSGPGGGGLNRVIRGGHRRHKPTGTAASPHHTPATKAPTPSSRARAHRARSPKGAQTVKPIKVKPVGTGVGRTLSAKPVATGLSAKAQRQSAKALPKSGTAPSLSDIANTVTNPAKLAAVLGANPHQLGLSGNPTTSGVGVDPGARLKKTKPEDVAIAVGTLAAPEIAGSAGRVISRLAKVAKEGKAAERVATDAAAVDRAPHGKVEGPARPGYGAEVRAEPKKGMRARATRAQTRASRAVEKPHEAPLAAARKIKVRATSPASKTTRAALGVAAIAPPVHGKGGSFGKRVEALAQGHLHAVEDNPLKVAATTARVAEGIPGAAAAVPAAVYTSIKHGSPKPLEGLAQQQVSYLNEVGKLWSGNPKTVEKTVTNKVGLVPAATALLGGVATAQAGKKISLALREGKIPVTKIDRATRKLHYLSEHGATESIRRDAAARLEAINKEGLRSKAHGTKREKERAGTREHRYATHLHREHKVLRKPLTKVARHSVERGAIKEIDVVQYLGRHGYGPDTHDLLGKIKRDGEAIVQDANHEVPVSGLGTKRVIQAILDHPELLKSKRVWKAVEATRRVQVGRSIERHMQDTGMPQESPNPKDERSRLATFMRSEGVLQGHERLAPELKDTTKLKERPGRNADQHARESAKRMQRKARHNRKLAEELRKAGQHTKADKLEARAVKAEAEANRRLDAVDSFKRAERLNRIAAKIDAGQTPTKSELAFAQQHGGSASELRDQAAQLRTQAERLREKGTASQQTRDLAAQAQAQAKIKAEGFQQPVYYKQQALDRPIAPEGHNGRPVPVQGSRKEKFKSGSLEQHGGIDESGSALLQNLETGRRLLAHDQSALDAITENAHVANVKGAEGVRFITDSEYAKLKRAGEVPSNLAKVGADKFAGPLQRNAAFRKEYEAAKLRASAQPKGGRGIYMLWKKSNLDEYKAQLEKVTTKGKIVQQAYRIQTTLMLGTSPTWFLFQIPATPLSVVARNWSPARYVRVAGKQIDKWRHATKYQKDEFNSHMGGGIGDILLSGDIHTNLKTDAMRGYKAALDLAYQSPVGRFVKGLGRNVAHGGPLIRANRAYEAHVRNFAAMMEMDRLSGVTRRGTPTVSARIVRFVDKTGRLTNSIYPLLKDLEGKKTADQIAWMNSHPKEMRMVENGLNDALGEWASMTKAERNASAVLVFYPFLRYSMRWFFYSFPKNNPLKAAILMNLAQSNDVELQKLLGGNPGLLQSFGNVVTYDAQGKAHAAINLARSSPGGNALIEAIGNGKIDLSTVLKPVQPILASGALALEHKSPFGEPAAPGTSSGDLFAHSMLSLSPLTRQGGPLPVHVGPAQSDASKLFAAIQGNPSSLVPRFVTDLRQQREVQRLQGYYDTVYGPGPSKADELKGLSPAEQRAGRKIIQHKQATWKKIDAMMQQYGVQTAATQKKQKKQYDKNSSYYYKHTLPKLYPQPKSKSSYGSSGYGGGGYGGSSYGG